MTIQLSNAAILEIADLSSRAEHLARGSSSDKAQATVLVQRISTIRQSGISSDEMRGRYTVALNESLNATPAKTTGKRYRIAWEKELLGKSLTESEQRDLLAGTQAISWTAGVQGGYTIPTRYSNVVTEAMAQFDPVLSPDVTGFEMTSTTQLQPQTIQGFDLSEVTASIVGETVQQEPSNFPNILGRVLRSDITYRISFAASLEFEQDSSLPLSKISRAMGIGLARKLGSDCINGSGAAGVPQGLNTALTPSYTTGSGKIDLTDLTSIYFSLNRAYRSQPLCSWLMSDSVYERIRQAVDTNGRPLIHIQEDTETILGKPVYVTPSLGALGGSLALNSTIIFGDLSAFKIRVSHPSLQRAINVPGFAEAGQAMYIGRVRADSAYFDPSNGAAPPIISATVVS